MRMDILVVHGPNLNLLGKRETGVYGESTLAEIDQQIRARAQALGMQVRIVQHSSEGAIVDSIHDSTSWADGIVINPAAYTHYSIAIRDALAAVSLPAVEVHLTNLAAREEFRNRSVISAVVKGVISGLGPESYLLALDYLAGPAHGL